MRGRAKGGRSRDGRETAIEPAVALSVLARLELRHLRYFTAVAEDLHFGRAARRLGLAQPPLSQQIGQLERLIGQRLFERKPRVSLTPAGEALLPVARRILGDVSAGVDAARRAGTGIEGNLTVGFASSILLGRFPAAIRAYRQRYPAVALRLHELASAEQGEALRRGSIDVGLLREPLESDDCVCETLFSESFAAAVPSGHPLAGEAHVSLAALAESPFVHFPRDVAPALHDRVIAMCAAAGFVPRVIQEAREWLTIVGLVDAGLGVAIVPASFRTLRWGSVRYLSVDGDEQSPVFIAWRAGEPARLVANFIEVMRDETGSHDLRA